MTAAKVATLSEFLLARIAEDEAVARHAAEALTRWARYRREDGREATPGELTLRIVDFTDEDLGEYDPARVLAECDAKRRIVGAHNETHECPKDGDNCGWWDEESCDVLRLLALPYADHSDYRDEWRP